MARSLAAPPSVVPRQIRTVSDLGASVRAQRLKLKLRIDDAAALAGISVGALSRLENGASALSFSALSKLLDALGLTLLVVPKGEAPPIDRSAQ